MKNGLAILTYTAISSLVFTSISVASDSHHSNANLTPLVIDPIYASDTIKPKRYKNKSKTNNWSTSLKNSFKQADLPLKYHSDSMLSGSQKNRSHRKSWSFNSRKGFKQPSLPPAYINDASTKKPYKNKPQHKQVFFHSSDSNKVLTSARHRHWVSDSGHYTKHFGLPPGYVSETPVVSQHTTQHVSLHTRPKATNQVQNTLFFGI